MSSIRVLTWLDDPYVLWRSWWLVIWWLFSCFFVLFLARACLLLWLWALLAILVTLLLILFLLCVLLLLTGRSFLVFEIFLALIVVLFESGEFGVIEASLDVERQRNIPKHVHIHCLVVILHVKEEGLLVVHMEVVLDLVIQLRLRELERISICMCGPCSILILWLWIALCCVSTNVLAASQCLVRALDSFLDLLAWLWLRRGQYLLHAWCSRLIARVAYVLDARALSWVFAWQRIHQVYFSYLSPAELSLFHFFLIVLYPPVPVFEEGTDHDRVITLADEILVNYIWWRVHERGLGVVIAWAGVCAIWGSTGMVHTLWALSIQFEVLW